MRIETITLNPSRNVTLTAYIQNVGGEFTNITTRPAMLILPGGGYELCSDLESDPVAMPYLKIGYQVFILKYSIMQNKTWPNPLNDYEQAMTLIHTNHEEWGVDPNKIGVIGFSAGGHLAGCAATMSVNRPNVAILGYALLNDDVKKYNISAPNVTEAVDSTTCPCFIFAARDDNVVSAANSLDFTRALFSAGIPFESHIYSFGPHGFSTADSSVQPQACLSARIPDWVPDSISWLKEYFGVLERFN